MPRILLLSNGHGEDAIGARLVPELWQRGLTVEALPIVGEGLAYRALGVPLVGPTQAMPSGGFVYGRPRALMGDLRHGLLGLTWGQLAAIKAIAPTCDRLLAIGDVVPLAFAWYSGRPYSFLGCAKSDLYRGGKPGAYGVHERWLMRHPRCQGVWPRDAVTTANLRAQGVRADWLGNPMMDGLEPQGHPLPGAATATSFLLLPGSRPEAPFNLRLLGEAARALTASPGRAVRFWVAVAPGLPLDALDSGGWRLLEAPLALQHPDGTTLHLVSGAFGDLAHAADLVLGMAGTATEQVVGLGKPVLSLPGPGPQFTLDFAEAQTRLLGESVKLIRGGPVAIADLAWRILGDTDRLARIRENGLARMGKPGASAQIADALAAL